MVNSTLTNGDGVIDVDQTQSHVLPEYVTLSKADLQQFPSPGTQRALRAETGKDYMALVGPDADSADRTQTQVWTKLRRTYPGLRWSECEEVGLLVDDAEGVSAANPSLLASSVPSPASVDSGD